jgi:hypothetical protein
MTGTNCDLFTQSVPVIFEPPCTSPKILCCLNVADRRLFLLITFDYCLYVSLDFVLLRAYTSERKCFNKMELYMKFF